MTQSFNALSGGEIGRIDSAERGAEFLKSFAVKAWRDRA
jgi:hypothetical protein